MNSIGSGLLQHMYRACREVLTVSAIAGSRWGKLEEDSSLQCSQGIYLLAWHHESCRYMNLFMWLHAENPCICMLNSHDLSGHSVSQLKGNRKLNFFSKKWHFHASAWHWLPCDHLDTLTVLSCPRWESSEVIFPFNAGYYTSASVTEIKSKEIA